MTEQQYQNLTPREATNDASTRLFSFARIRSGSTTRFYPGDGAKLHFANRDVDTLEIPGVPSGYLAAGDVVTASYRGACVFRGEVATIVENRCRGTDETQTVTCVGPWSKMQRLVYRQQWKTGASSYDLSSRLILNQTRGGAAQSLDSELYEIASHGKASCGYSVSASDIGVSSQILPFDECRDITVADAIKRELRFFPKAVCRFDYSGATPALKIAKSASPATASYVADIPKSLREYVYNAHPITGVDLEIESTGTVNGVEYHQISHQKAGDTEAGNPDCLYATLQIRGASSSATYQSFKSVTEDEDIPTNLNDVNWWKAHHPRLANVATSAITIERAGRTPSNLPRISAATAGELEAAGLRCEVTRCACFAKIATEEDEEEEIYLVAHFLTTNATGTAANPKTYTWVSESSSESGETVPSGLAATILAERSGRLLSERMTIRLGDTFPTLGDAIVEDEGAVFLQSFDVDCGDLTADLSFGVPDYLSPEDMASLLSGFRNKCTTSSSSMRKEGKPNKGDEIQMGAIPPLSSSEFAPGKKAKTTIRSSSGSGGSIELDSAKLGGGENMSVREMTVAGENGKEKKIKVLATDDFSAAASGVSSVNSQTGDVSVIGGESIEVSTDGKTIRISYKEGKEEDPDPNKQQGGTPGPGGDPANPCAHDGAGGAGGVNPADAGSGGGGGGGGAGPEAGGVPAAGGEPHTGDNNCNC